MTLICCLSVLDVTTLKKMDLQALLVEVGAWHNSEDITWAHTSHIRVLGLLLIPASVGIHMLVSTHVEALEFEVPAFGLA